MLFYTLTKKDSSSLVIFWGCWKAALPKNSMSNKNFVLTNEQLQIQLKYK